MMQAFECQSGRDAVFAIPHLLQRILSFLDYRPLTRCLRINTEWYDAATASLWRHVSYRSNPWLIDPGVTPFLPVNPAPPEDSAHTEDVLALATLRGAKRRAMRHVKVIEIRTHKCEQVECDKMTLHDEYELGTGAADESTEVGDSVVTGAQPSTQPLSHLLALRLHLDEKHPRPLPYPCPFVSRLDARTIVLVPLRRLSNPRPLPFPALPSLRKLVLLMIPHTGPPETHSLAGTTPTTVTDIVIFLWRRQAGNQGAYDHFQGSWSHTMKRRGWGPEKIWSHWCNFILAYTRLYLVAAHSDGTDVTARPAAARRPTFTFVNTGIFDPTWLDMADNGPVDFSTGDQSPTNTGRCPDETTYKDTQDRFAAGLRRCLERKVRDLPGCDELAPGLQLDMMRCSDQVRFISRDEYLAEGQWEGEFTREEVMYHG